MWWNSTWKIYKGQSSCSPILAVLCFCIISLITCIWLKVLSIYMLKMFILICWHITWRKICLLTGRGLVVSWALCAVCIFGHVSHFFGAKAAWIHALHSTGFHISLSIFTLLGPGRQLIVDGLRSLLRGAPNMNTLVGLGALSSFAVSSLAALMPKLVICFICKFK